MSDAQETATVDERISGPPSKGRDTEVVGQAFLVRMPCPRPQRVISLGLGGSTVYGNKLRSDRHTTTDLDPNDCLEGFEVSVLGD
jgi:hypothetical protein